MTVAATVREYIWLPEAEIAPTRQSRAQVDIPLAVVDAVNTTPVILNVHADHLGRPVKMTNAAKASVWDVVFTPWGAPHTLTGAQTLNERFPGQWFQLESGLHYNWHRHYDPSLGRYTQPDPLGFVDGPSQYAYGRNSPQTRVDRFGLYTDWTGEVIKVPQDLPPSDTNCWSGYFIMQFVCKSAPRCKGTDTCETLTYKRDTFVECIKIQKRLNICYGDDENADHGNKFPDFDGAVQNCIDHMKRGNCFQCPGRP